jgi:fructose-1,6-bisphosphatase/inositol monophosphatase family enzyme
MVSIIEKENIRKEIINYISDLLVKVNELIILKYYKNLSSKHINTKSSDDDYVSIADKESEIYIVKNLIGFLNINQYIGEETSYTNKDDYKSLEKNALYWVIDPIDGTKNYINGKNEFCSMISLVFNSIPIASFVYYPLKNLLVYAFKGFGAYSLEIKTKKIIQLRIQQNSFDNIVGSGGTKGIEEPLRQKVLQNLRKYTNRLFIGSAGIEAIMLASNETQFVFHGRVTPWDHSPLDLIIKESGGCVYMLNDKAEFNIFSRGPILAASNDQIWENIRSLALK